MALIVLSPLLIAITIWLHFANKGAGAFFTQERPGKGEKNFKIIKFKSMTDERDSNGRLLPGKERITVVGRFIRKTSIDELPQLINVLKGDMALIGPRPLLPEYLPYYTERERLRHTVRPGISGWAQVNGRNNISWDGKLECDAYYVEHLSFWMDVRVLMTTFKNILGGSKDVNVVPVGKLNAERADRKLRLIGRRLEESDLRLRVEWMNNPKVYSSMHYDIPVKIENTFNWFRGNIGNDKRVDLAFEDDGMTVAFGGLTGINRQNNEAEFYIFVNPNAQKCGIGTQATNILCHYGFNELSLNKIYLKTNEDNIIAQHVYEKCGFKLEGVLREEYRNKDGNMISRMYYGLLKSEFND